MTTLSLLQHYWWAIISLLGALLVFLMFVQGGQGLLYIVGRTPLQRNMIVNSLGRKWELTFTTLVTFGGAFFASFPLFYSTSFGGAYYVWFTVLIVFVLQAVAYEYRRKPNNVLGEKTYNIFLLINGIVGPLVLGVAVATLFTGAGFTVDRLNLANAGGDTVISQWSSPWHGLEALADYRNVALGLAVMFLSQILALHFFINNIDDADVRSRSARYSGVLAIPFLITFLLFIGAMLASQGWGYDPASGTVGVEKYKFLENMLQMPAVTAVFLVGVIMVLAGLWMGIRASRRAVWFSGAGTLLTVVALLLCAGWNNTCYYPSTSDAASSLTIANSSSSEFTLTVMSWVSLLIPFVVGYIWYAWRALSKPVSPRDTEGDAY